jgi:hypothetical protein
MAQMVAEKPVCGKCGSDVRDGTAFCYNCGASVVQASVETVGDVDVMVTADSNGTEAQTTEANVDPVPEANDRVKLAAKERKKARVSSRKPVEYTWEPSGDLRFPLLWAVVLTVIVAVITAVMVFWK